MEGYQILNTLLLMIILIWRRIPIGYVMLGCSAMLALMYRTHIIDFFMMLWRGVTNPVTMELVIILIFIMVFEALLRKEGYLENMLTGLQAVIPNPRIVMALLPIFIGVMPSAGGALFSAPLVEHAAKDLSATPEQKSFVNFYYRHVTEYFLPIYPSVLLIASMANLHVRQLILALIPFGALAVLLGIPELKKIAIVKKEDHERTEKKQVTKELLLSALPILIVVFLVLVVATKVWIGVGSVLLYLFIYHRYTPNKIWNLLRDAFKFKTIFLVFAVMIFKQVLEDTGAVAALPQLLSQLPVPSYFVFIVINFIVGVMTGHMIAIVGIGFPLALAVLGASFDVQTAVLLFIAGFAGQMITPTHLCLTLTVNFFKADLSKVIRMLIGREAALLAAAIAVYMII
ncbi:MAG: DUF401 family protein [Dehalobacterium sp.]|jgi:integral membrane protein (TIGR00529 family)